MIGRKSITARKKIEKSKEKARDKFGNKLGIFKRRGTSRQIKREEGTSIHAREDNSGEAVEDREERTEKDAIETVQKDDQFRENDIEKSKVVLNKGREVREFGDWVGIRVENQNQEKVAKKSD